MVFYPHDILPQLLGVLARPCQTLLEVELDLPVLLLLRLQLFLFVRNQFAQRFKLLTVFAVLGGAESVEVVDVVFLLLQPLHQIRSRVLEVVLKL